jgi:hypothetical protein
MPTPAEHITEQLHAGIERTPVRYRSLLLRLMHSLRESIEADERWLSASKSFREGLTDALAGRINPADTLRNGIDAD